MRRRCALLRPSRVVVVGTPEKRALRFRPEPVPLHKGAQRRLQRAQLLIERGQLVTQQLHLFAPRADVADDPLEMHGRQRRPPGEPPQGGLPLGTARRRRKSEGGEAGVAEGPDTRDELREQGSGVPTPVLLAALARGRLLGPTHLLGPLIARRPVAPARRGSLALPGLL